MQDTSKAKQRANFPHINGVLFLTNGAGPWVDKEMEVLTYFKYKKKRVFEPVTSLLGIGNLISKMCFIPAIQCTCKDIRCSPIYCNKSSEAI